MVNRGSRRARTRPFRCHRMTGAGSPLAEQGIIATLLTGSVWFWGPRCIMGGGLESISTKLCNMQNTAVLSALWGMYRYCIMWTGVNIQVYVFRYKHNPSVNETIRPCPPILFEVQTIHWVALPKWFWMRAALYEKRSQYKCDNEITGH